MVDALMLSRAALRRLLDLNAVRDVEGLAPDVWDAGIMFAEEAYDISGEPLEDLDGAEYEAALVRVHAAMTDRL